ncbi:MAG TPA: hypothetical protein VNK04_14475 [Gemmataceae bacterium]|nr:hypothetical protein [Gemmataceae bacterium]
MKLAVTSDLHFPITPVARITVMARPSDVFSPHALVLAGDVAESLYDVEECLAIITRLVSCPVLVLAGRCGGA